MWLKASMPPGLPSLAGTLPFNFIGAASGGHASGGPKLEVTLSCRVREKDGLPCAGMTSLPGVGILISAHSTFIECLLWGAGSVKTCPRPQELLI